jgi:Alkaline phosphatase
VHKFHLTSQGTRGYRGDGRDMIEEWKEAHADMGKAEYIWNRQQLKNLDIENTDYVLGLFEADHLRYAIDVRQAGLQQQEPTLADLTETAIKMLQKNDNGYVLFIEGWPNLNRVLSADFLISFVFKVDELIMHITVIMLTKRWMKPENLEMLLILHDE